MCKTVPIITTILTIDTKHIYVKKIDGSIDNATISEKILNPRFFIDFNECRFMKITQKLHTHFTKHIIHQIFCQFSIQIKSVLLDIYYFHLRDMREQCILYKPIYLQKLTSRVIIYKILNRQKLNLHDDMSIQELVVRKFR